MTVPPYPTSQTGHCLQLSPSSHVQTPPRSRDRPSEPARAVLKPTLRRSLFAIRRRSIGFRPKRPPSAPLLLNIENHRGGLLSKINRGDRSRPRTPWELQTDDAAPALVQLGLGGEVAAANPVGLLPT